MSTDMQLQVVACLLRQGRSLDQLSTGLTMLGVVLGLAPLLTLPVAPMVLLLSLGIITVGLLHKYCALRVAFDADLFALMADALHHTPQLDLALQTLGLQPANKAGRSWTERCHGALALLHKQAWLFGAQVMLTLAAIFTSFWLRFCG